MILCIIFIQVPISASGEVFRFVETDTMNIALTFDDGPHPKYTREILAILDEYNVKATFFMIGSNAEREPELVSEVAAAGHEIGNHTYNHEKPWKLCKSDLHCELSETADVICQGSGVSPVLFRPPEGVISGFITPAAAEMGYNIILWSVDTRDWEKNTTCESVYENVIQNIKPGGIILFHDAVSRSDSVTPEALRQVIPVLLEKGYNFVTVSELTAG